MTDTALRRPRGRPRSESCRVRILAAAGELMLEGGLPAATMEAIAARAGVSKATIYRWWPSRGAVALDGLLASAAHSLVVPDDSPTVEALRHQVAAVIELLDDTPTGQLLRALAAAAQSDPELGRELRDRWLAPRRAVAAEVLHRGIARGDLRPDVDVPLVLDQLFAPVYYRLLFGHDPLHHDLAADLVGNLLDGIAARAEVS